MKLKMMDPKRPISQLFVPALLVLGVVVSVPEALAVDAGGVIQTAPAGKPTTPWHDPQRQDCGQTCLYQKANETIALQSTYLLSRLEGLSEAVSKGEESKVLKNLQGFCLAGEGYEDCYHRYKMVQIVALQKMRSAIIKNNDSSASLMSQVGTFGRGTDGKARTPQVPYVVTFEDLQREYSQIQRLSSTAYNDWARSLPFKPSETDFVKFKSIPKDPENPKNGGSLQVIQRDSQGNIVYDQKAYEKALKDYNDRMKSEYARMSQPPYERPLDSRPSTGTLEDQVTPEAKEALAEGRKPIVKAANQAIRATGIQSQSVVTYPGPSRAVASGSSRGGEEHVDRVMPVAAESRREISIQLTPEELGKWIEDVKDLP